MTTAAEALIIFVLILINGLLAMSEMAIVSARKARLQQLAEAGDEGAKIALSLANAPSDFLASIQIGITLVGIFAGAFGGATIASQIGPLFATIPGLAAYSDAIGLGIVIVVVTFLSLIFGELVPKRIALNNAERTAAAVARPIRFLSIVATPVVRALGFATNTTLKVIGAKAFPESSVSEEEVNIMMEQGTQAGIFEKEEETMVKRVLKLGDRRVGELMTQRVKLISLDIDAPFRENLVKIIDSQHSYFPVYRDIPDRLIGIVSTKGVLEQMAKEKADTIDLKTCLTEPLYVAEGMPVLMLLERLKRSAKHLAVVVDEYGGTAGIVTIVDVLEAIVGDLPAEDESQDSRVVKREDGSWLIDGLLSLDEFEEFIDHLGFVGGLNGDFQTVGGFVMEKLGRIPKVGEYFLWHGFRIEVVDMDGRRVDKIIFSHVGDAPQPNATMLTVVKS